VTHRKSWSDDQSHRIVLIGGGIGVLTWVLALVNGFL
jgi:hypothetical protein